jgi:hypothetical protein
MCHACENDGYDDDDVPFNFQDAPEEIRGEFFDYITEQMGLVIDKAESAGVLYQLITEWPNERIIHYELATIMEGRSLNDSQWNEEG